LSLRTRFIVYLLVVHALLAAAGIYFFRENRLWLFAVEAVFVGSLATGVVLVRRMFRALAFVGESAQFLNDSDYTTRFLEVGQPEIDRLIAVYNRMVDSLRAERQRVQEQHYFLGRVLDVSPSGILVLDFDGRIDLINPAAERLLQRPADSLRGATLAGSGVPILETLASLGSGEGRVTAIHGGRRVRAQRGTFLDRGFPRSFFLLEDGAVDDITHAILLQYSNAMQRVSAAGKSLTDCRRTCARRCWQADAAASDRRRRTASAGSPRRRAGYRRNAGARWRVR